MIRLIDFLLGKTRKDEIPAWRRRRFLEKHSDKRAKANPQAMCKHVTPPLKPCRGRTEFANISAGADPDRPGWARKRDRRRKAGNVR